MVRTLTTSGRSCCCCCCVLLEVSMLLALARLAVELASREPTVAGAVARVRSMEASEACPFACTCRDMWPSS